MEGTYKKPHLVRRFLPCSFGLQTADCRVEIPVAAEWRSPVVG